MPRARQEALRSGHSAGLPGRDDCQNGLDDHIWLVARHIVSGGDDNLAGVPWAELEPPSLRGHCRSLFLVRRIPGVVVADDGEREVAESATVVPRLMLDHGIRAVFNVAGGVALQLGPQFGRCFGKVDGAHRVDEHHPLDLIGMGEGIASDEVSPTRRTDKDVRGLDLGTPQQGLEVATQVLHGPAPDGWVTATVAESLVGADPGLRDETRIGAPPAVVLVAGTVG